MAHGKIASEALANVLVNRAFVNQYAGDIVEAILSDPRLDGIVKGRIDKGPFVAHAIFQYQSALDALLAIRAMTGYDLIIMGWRLSFVEGSNDHGRQTEPNHASR